jgi:hypothetical protein
MRRLNIIVAVQEAFQALGRVAANYTRKLRLLSDAGADSPTVLFGDDFACFPRG